MAGIENGIGSANDRKIYNHELRGCRCVYLCLAWQQTTPSCFYTLMCIYFSFLQLWKPGGAVLKQPHFELMIMVLYPHLQPFPSSAAVSYHFLLFFSRPCTAQSSPPFHARMAAARGNDIIPPVLAGEEDAVTQREPRHHLTVEIPSLTQTAGMRGGLG